MAKDTRRCRESRLCQASGKWHEVSGETKATMGDEGYNMTPREKVERASTAAKCTILSQTHSHSRLDNYFIFSSTVRTIVHSVAFP